MVRIFFTWGGAPAFSFSFSLCHLCLCERVCAGSLTTSGVDVFVGCFSKRFIFCGTSDVLDVLLLFCSRFLLSTAESAVGAGGSTGSPNSPWWFLPTIPAPVGICNGFPSTIVANLMIAQRQVTSTTSISHITVSYHLELTITSYWDYHFLPSYFTFVDVHTHWLSQLVRMVLIPKSRTIWSNLKVTEGWNFSWVTLSSGKHAHSLDFKKISACSNVFVEWWIFLIWKHMLVNE